VINNLYSFKKDHALLLANQEAKKSFKRGKISLYIIDRLVENYPELAWSDLTKILFNNINLKQNGTNNRQDRKKVIQ